MENKRVTCQHCECSFFPENGATLDDCPKCGRTVEVKPALAPVGLNRRQRRCIRNSAERFDHLGYGMGDELRECFPEAFVNLGKGRM